MSKLFLFGYHGCHYHGYHGCHCCSPIFSQMWKLLLRTENINFWAYIPFEVWEYFFPSLKIKLRLLLLHLFILFQNLIIFLWFGDLVSCLSYSWHWISHEMSSPGVLLNTVWSKFCMKKGFNDAQILAMLERCFSRDSRSSSNTFRRWKCFKSGHEWVGND